MLRPPVMYALAPFTACLLTTYVLWGHLSSSAWVLSGLFGLGLTGWLCFAFYLISSHSSDFVRARGSCLATLEHRPHRVLGEHLKQPGGPRGGPADDGKRSDALDVAPPHVL